MTAFDDLVAYYELLGRDEAIARLRQCIVTTSDRYAVTRGLFYSAPRPYPLLVRSGFRWTKEGPYWIAFDGTATEPLISALFHETADIAGRL